MTASGHSVARYPYAATWHGNIAALQGRSGVLSVHRTPTLAVQACLRMRNSLSRFWGAYKPWFGYAVIDRRSGETIRTVT
jgi:hypothetical protein